MFKELDPLLHSELRLAIVSLLAGVKSAEFTYIKDKCGATSGNLSVQLDKLSKSGYIAIEKGYNGKKPLTTCNLTDEGKEALLKYIDALKSYIVFS